MPVAVMIQASVTAKASSMSSAKQRRPESTAGCGCNSLAANISSAGPIQVIFCAISDRSAVRRIRAT